MTIPARRVVVAAFGCALLVLAALWLRSPPSVSVPAPAASDVTPTPTSSALPDPVPPAEMPGAPLPLPVPPVEEVPPAATDAPYDIEGLVFALTNGLRSRNGLPALARDGALEATARAFSQDMLQRGFFAHVDPDGRGPADRVARISGLPPGAVGENIWMWSGSSQPARHWLAEQAVAAWAASPAHRENILRPAYTHLGIGAAMSAGDVRITQLFRE